MLPEPEIPKKPPGPQRPYPQPTSTGTIPFQPQRFNISSSTAYWTWGTISPTAIPLILLHGGPGVTHKYMSPFSLLATDYNIPVITYDQIGCGESTHFRSRKGDVDLWTPELFIEELENLITWTKEEWGVTQFDVLGHSWGGKLAALFALRAQPKGLRKLIICNSNTDTNVLVAGRQRLRKLMPEVVQEVFRRQEAGLEVQADDLAQARAFELRLHVCRHQPSPPELGAAFAALQDDDTVHSTMMGQNMDGSMTSLRRILEGKMAAITKETCPGGLLVVSGEFDTTDEEAVRPFFEEPTCKVKWVRFGLSSHFVMYEEPEALMREIGRFLTMES